MMRLLTLLIVFLYFLSCSPYHIIGESGRQAKDRYTVTIENFPSWDTASIVFYESNNMWYKKINYTLFGKMPDSVHCINCKTVFMKPLFDSLINLKNETIFMDCRKISDTIINGEHIGSIEDFYAATNHQLETIIVRTGTSDVRIKYISPREALTYCKDNTDRLKFIYMMDSLRSVK